MNEFLTSQYWWVFWVDQSGIRALHKTPVGDKQLQTPACSALTHADRTQLEVIYNMNHEMSCGWGNRQVKGTQQLRPICFDWWIYSYTETNLTRWLKRLWTLLSLSKAERQTVLKCYNVKYGSTASGGRNPITNVLEVQYRLAYGSVRRRPCHFTWLKH